MKFWYFYLLGGLNVESSKKRSCFHIVNILQTTMYRLFSLLILLIIFVFGFSYGVSCQATTEFQDAFTVSNIHVDVTANTASAARKEALSVGEKEAFNSLLRRLTMRIDHNRLPKLNAEEISPYVQDFGISNEKNSQIRYLADLTFRFKPGDIRQLLRENEVGFAETISKPLLILPIYQVAGAVSLWDNPNSWREAWIEASKLKKAKIKTRMSGLVPMVFGKGDLTDISLMSAELAVKGDKQRILAIAKRHKVSTVLVVFASLGSTGQGLKVLDITVSRYSQNKSEKLYATQIRAIKDEGVGALLSRSANELIFIIEDLWKAENLLRYDSVGVIAAVLPIKGLKEWVHAKKRFEKIAVIERIDLILFSRTEVRLNIHFIGENKQLKLALAQVDMELSEGQGSWTVKFQQSKGSLMKHSVDQK